MALSNNENNLFKKLVLDPIKTLALIRQMSDMSEQTVFNRRFVAILLAAVLVLIVGLKKHSDDNYQGNSYEVINALKRAFVSEETQGMLSNIQQKTNEDDPYYAKGDILGINPKGKPIKLETGLSESKKDKTFKSFGYQEVAQDYVSETKSEIAANAELGTGSSGAAIVKYNATEIGAKIDKERTTVRSYLNDKEQGMTVTIKGKEKAFSLNSGAKALIGQGNVDALMENIQTAQLSNR